MRCEKVSLGRVLINNVQFSLLAGQSFSLRLELRLCNNWALNLCKMILKMDELYNFDLTVTLVFNHFFLQDAKFISEKMKNPTTFQSSP